MAAHRYWRVRGRPESGTFSCGELELRGTVGGPDLTGGGTAIASSEFSGAWLAAYAFNNVIMPAWSATAADGDPWIGYDFGAGNDVEILEISWTSRSDGSPNTNPTSFSVERSDDGITWTEEASQAGITGWTLGETRTYEWATSDPAQEVRFHALNLSVANTGEPNQQVRFHALGLEVAYSLNEATGSWKPQVTIIVS